MSAPVLVDLDHHTQGVGAACINVERGDIADWDDAKWLLLLPLLNFDARSLCPVRAGIDGGSCGGTGWPPDYDVSFLAGSFSLDIPIEDTVSRRGVLAVTLLVARVLDCESGLRRNSFSVSRFLSGTKPN
jgi:hypothetical protein